MAPGPLDHPSRPRGNREERLPVFVYGTLRRGEKNHLRYFEGRIRFLGMAAARGELYVHLEEEYCYPCLLPGEGEVKGELVEPRPELYDLVLAELDALEDYDPRSDSGLYLRRPIDVLTEEGEAVRCWGYLWNGPGKPGPKVEGGDFVAWRKKREGR